MESISGNKIYKCENCQYKDIEAEFQLQRKEPEISSAIPRYTIWYQCPRCYSKAIVDTIDQSKL